MTPAPSEPTSDPGDPASGDTATDLALYALGALDDTELRSVETLLATDAAAAAAEARLRRATGELAAAADTLDTAPPLDLRDRVLGAARRERPPSQLDGEPIAPAELHRILGDVATNLLDPLTDADRAMPVDPPEFAGWTVGDLVAHLTTVEAYLAQQLGIDDPVAPERQHVNEHRTADAIARHRTLDHARAVDELRSFLGAVDDDVARHGDPTTRAITWWGNETTVDRILVVRAFELWTHAADIARAVGHAEPTPSAASLRTMSDLATALTPVMCALGGTLPASATGGWVRFTLTGPGGATHDVPLGLGGTSPLTGEPTATMTLDIVDYCRTVAQRIDPEAVPYEVTGDAAIAAAVIASLPALATL